MGKRFKLDRRDGRWQVLAQDTANALWFSLGGCTDLNTALGLWLALLGERDRK